MYKVAFHTLGCKLNYAETSALGKQFAERGYRAVSLEDAPDVFVLNTCTVTENADREARQIIRRALRHAPHAMVVVTGCYAQLQPAAIAAIDGVDFVLGSSEKFHMFKHIPRDPSKTGTAHVACAAIGDSDDFGPALSAEQESRTRAFLKIQDGCDYTCTFCTIPQARGASRSQSIAATVTQAAQIAASGYQEIILTGVNVGDYGKKDGTNLHSLLQSLERVAGIERIRISSIEPNLFTPELIDFAARSQKICPHFHIPLQSGSNVVLGLMRRRYNSSLYARLVTQIITAIPHAGIGVDVITGFPGETDAHFLETYNFLCSLPIAYLHVFTYSERENTPAAAFAAYVPVPERKRRTEMLRSLSAMKRRAFAGRFAGTVRPVLFEHAPRDGCAVGYTDNYIRVSVPFDAALCNVVVPVRLVEYAGDMVAGEIEPQHARQVHSMGQVSPLV